MKFAFHKFPVRPAPASDESLVGYIYRLHSDNSHSLTQGEFLAIKSAYRSYDGSEESKAWIAIKALAGGNFNFKRWRSFFIYSQEANRQGLTVEVLRFKPELRVCPHCLRDKGYFSALWEIQIYSICDVHKCWLVNKCSRCGVGLKWPNLDVEWRCKCGFSLKLAVTRSVHPWWVEWPRIIAKVFQAILTEDQNCFSAKSSFERIFMCANVKALVRHHWGRRDWPSPDLYAWEYLRRSNVWIHRALRDWPNGLRAELRTLLKLRWRRCRDHFVLLKRDDALLIEAVKQRARYIDFDLRLNRCTRDSIDEVLTELRTQLGFQNVVLLNPHWNDVRGTKRLQQFASWWARQCSHIKKTGRLQSAVRLSQRAVSPRREVLAICALNQLIALSEKKKPVASNIADVIGRWLVIDHSITRCETLVEHLGELFMMIPYAALQRLNTLLYRELHPPITFRQKKPRR
jgi:hypothetical protein